MKFVRYIVLTVVCILFMGLYLLEPWQERTLPTDHYELATKITPITVSFAAVGDNLIHGAIYYDARTGENTYDFTPYYTEVKDYIQEADVSFINQETVIGGKAMGLSHYPQFNSPEEVVDAIVDTGFDLVNTASNHSLDKREQGIVNAMNTFAKYPELVVNGTNASQEQAEELRILESKGVKIGFLAYTYGTNGIPTPSGKEYLVNRIEKEKIIADIEEITPECDILVVSMHWGTEDSHTVNSMQEEYVDLLHSLGVDVIIGTHPHVIQKSELVVRDGHEMLVMYSLGNFLSAQDKVKNMLELMMLWEIEYSPLTDEVHFSDIEAVPLINHFDSGFRNFKVYPLKEYTEELAKRHGLDFTKQQMVDLTQKVMGEEIKIAWE
ncbi:MAG: CapA family protein [Erysipelotrichaceae bacterium]|nr:CapA family protein [Erysipelotrichaceae bacterium]